MKLVILACGLMVLSLLYLCLRTIDNPPDNIRSTYGRIVSLPITKPLSIESAGQIQFHSAEEVPGTVLLADHRVYPVNGYFSKDCRVGFGAEVQLRYGRIIPRVIKVVVATCKLEQ